MANQLFEPTKTIKTTCISLYIGILYLEQRTKQECSYSNMFSWQSYDPKCLVIIPV